MAVRYFCDWCGAEMRRFTEKPYVHYEEDKGVTEWICPRCQGLIEDLRLSIIVAARHSEPKKGEVER